MATDTVVLVKMSKAGETIEVNPLCVEDHKQLGWTIVEPVALTDEPPPAPEKKKVKQG
jgi:hypothetical protein